MGAICKEAVCNDKSSSLGSKGIGGICAALIVVGVFMFLESVDFPFDED